MRDDFCAFILSHNRPNRVYTYNTLKKSGYTGKIFIVIDDEDESEKEYRARFGENVIQFCKRDYAEQLDEGDNSGKRISTIYARAAMFDLAKNVGCKYFIQLDDDYESFVYRLTQKGQIVRKNMDQVLTALVNWFESIPALSIAMSQGGDHMGGDAPISLRRKAMNSFICDVSRPWVMFGRMNEDVNTYVLEAIRGKLFFTVLPIQLNQKETQSNAGGMTDLYLETGTYVKSFYTVMYAPSCTKITFLKDPRHDHGRIHHKINWNRAAPKILRNHWRKSDEIQE